MAKELPIFPAAPQPEGGAPSEEALYARVFCCRENSPPLRLLLDFLRAKGQVPLVPKMDPAALDEWAWVQIGIGYHRERKPLQLFCLRDRGTYEDAFRQEQQAFLDRLSLYDEVEAQLAREYVQRARFIVISRWLKADITDEGYDFNGWVLEFFQDQCNGIVQIDNQGFFSPKGELVVDMQDTGDEPDAIPNASPAESPSS